MGKSIAKPKDMFDVHDDHLRETVINMVKTINGVEDTGTGTCLMKIVANRDVSNEVQTIVDIVPVNRMKMWIVDPINLRGDLDGKNVVQIRFTSHYLVSLGE